MIIVALKELDLARGFAPSGPLHASRKSRLVSTEMNLTADCSSNTNEPMTQRES